MGCYIGCHLKHKFLIVYTLLKYRIRIHYKCKQVQGFFVILSNLVFIVIFSKKNSISNEASKQITKDKEGH